MDKDQGPSIYSIAAHRGFADALVAGIVPRYSDPDVGLARLTLLVPSSRAARTLSEAFIRQMGNGDAAGMLMPRMVAVGDLDLDEALGALLDPLGYGDIPPAVEPTRRWLEIADLIDKERAELGESAMPGAARLRLARETARTMDRMLVEGKSPEDLIGDAVLDMLDELSEHWQNSLRLFARVQARWRIRLEEHGEVDAATRRNMLFERAAQKWRSDPPSTPIVAAGVTSTSPALARMLRVIADLPNGAVVLPDLDLSLSQDAWDELGRAGAAPEAGGEVFGARDALTHPQYHLKLLLERMGIAREEVRPWHRKGASAAPPERSHAISSLFLPPQASKSWIDLPPEKRRLSGVRLITSATSEEEAQAIALLVREALEQPEKRIAVVTADRSLARRVAQHLARWNIDADDSAGRALSLTPAGRLFGLLAQLVSHGTNPAYLIGALAHPLVRSPDPHPETDPETGPETGPEIGGEAGPDADADARRDWLRALRKFDRKIRGPAPAPGLESLREIARKAGVEEWWNSAETVLAPLFEIPPDAALADMIDLVAGAAEAFAGEAVWAREDGRALAAMVEDLRLNARALDTRVSPGDLAAILRDSMEEIAVRPPYGGHPRVAIYGLLESRMARADLVICGALNEGTWPQPPGSDALLAPAILRVLGVPGAEFRIGLSAHDLAGALGAPEVVLSRALRDADGPTLPSRFLLRVEALLGDLLEDHQDRRIAQMVPEIDRRAEPAPPYPRPMPSPTADQRKLDIKATALDRLLGDPYQFYAEKVLGLRKLDPLAVDPFADPALRGTLVHDILEKWHAARAAEPDLALVPFAAREFEKARVHPLFKGLWQPRLLTAMERFEQRIDENAAKGRQIIAAEADGSMMVRGIKVHGRADRIDRMPDGTLAVVDYKTGKPPSARQVEAGFALQMGLLGLIARDGGFSAGDTVISGEVSAHEYWSLGKDKGEFAYFEEPMRVSKKRTGLSREDFLPAHEAFLHEAIDTYLLGDAPFTAKANPDYPGYTDYDQLMRLDEWKIRLTDAPENGAAGEGEP